MKEETNQPLPAGSTPSPLKAARFLCGYTQGDVARALNLDVALVSRIESGKINQTRHIIKTKAKICEFLGVPKEQVCPETEAPEGSK